MIIELKEFKEPKKHSFKHSCNVIIERYFKGISKKVKELSNNNNNMANKEYKIGEKIKWENITLLVKKAPTNAACMHCYFYGGCKKHLFQEVNSVVGVCSAGLREDNENVIFVEDKDNKNEVQQVSFMHANQMLLEGLAAWGRYCEKLDGLFNNKNNNNMETKEMKIVPPEGYKIDKENSTFECIKFKPIKKALTYEEVAKKLFYSNNMFYINLRSEIEGCFCSDEKIAKEYNNCTSHKQAEKLLAINKLMNVAKYLNGEWKPDCRTQSYYIAITDGNIKVFISYPTGMDIYFKSGKLAQQAIDILGEETIRLALSTDW